MPSTKNIGQVLPPGGMFIGLLQGRQRHKAFIWVDTMLGNVKNTIYGTYPAQFAPSICRANSPNTHITSTGASIWPA